MKSNKPSHKKEEKKKASFLNAPAPMRELCEAEGLPRWAANETELSAVLRKQRGVLRGYRDRLGAPYRWVSTQGYDVWSLRWWMHENGFTPGVNARTGRATDKLPPATPSTATPPGGVGGASGTASTRLKEAQAAKQEASAAEAELDLKERMGELVPLDEVKQRDVARVMMVKRGLMAFPREVCSLLYGLTVPEMEAVMQQKVRDLLERFSKTTSEVKPDEDKTTNR